MPRVNPLVASFTAGEAGPRMAARSDLDAYFSLCEVSENLIILPQGGLMRRSGTRYVAETKGEAYLVSFEAGIDNAYIIEGGANYFRFFRDQGQLVTDDTDASITNGTFDSNITGWDDRSGAGSSISHDSTNDRLSLTSNGTTEAVAEQDVNVGVSFRANSHTLRFTVHGVAGDYVYLRVGSTSTGTDIVSDVFFGVGYHCYSFTPDSAAFYVQFVNELGKTIGIDNVDLLDNSPLEISTPYTAAQVKSLSHPQANDVMYIMAGGTTPVYKLQRLGDTSWSLEEVNFLDGPYLDQNINPILLPNSTTGLGFGGSTTSGFSSTTLSPSATSGLGITITASDTEGINGGLGFQSTDVGRLVRIQDSASADAGYAVITAVGSTTSVTADVRRDFNATTATTRWWIGAFSGTTGYPSAATFHQQRMVMAGSTSYPQSLWVSQSADIENMRPDSFVASELTVEDDDAIAITLAAKELSTTRWVESIRNAICVGTNAGEWIIDSEGAVLTPTDISAEQHTRNGSAAATPIQIDDVVLYIQRAKRKVMDFTFVFERQNFKARDLNILAHRIAGSGFSRLEYQKDPDSVVWALRADGQVGILTYKTEEDIAGWGRVKLGGAFSGGDAVVESVATIPGEAGGGRTLDSDERNEVWCVGKRTINSATKRFVEFFERSFEGPIREDYSTESDWQDAMITAQEDAMYVDSGLTYSGVSTTTLSGLDHLEGQTVKILANGAIHPDKTVSSGSITLDYAVTKAQVGLGYKHRYKSLKMPFGSQAGTAVGKVKRIHGITFVLLDSATFMFGKDFSSLENVEFRAVDEDMDTAVPLFVGEKNRDFGGVYDTDARIVVESDAPSPWTMLAIAPEMKTNELL